MSVQHFEVVSFEPWKDGVVRIRIAVDEPEGRVCHTFYARQEDCDDRVKECDTHAAEVARLTAAGQALRDATDALVLGSDPQAGGSPDLIRAMNAWDAIAPAARKESDRG